MVVKKNLFCYRSSIHLLRSLVEKHRREGEGKEEGAVDGGERALEEEDRGEKSRNDNGCLNFAFFLKPLLAFVLNNVVSGYGKHLAN